MKHPKARILVVEDDQAILNGLSDVLVFNGYAVQGSEDGGEGLEMILNEQFDHLERMLLYDVFLYIIWLVIQFFIVIVQLLTCLQY